MEYNDDEGLDKLRRGLYSRKGIRLKNPTHRSEPEERNDVKDDWTYESADQQRTETLQRARETRAEEDSGRPKWLTIFLVGTIGVFLIAAGTFAYRFMVAGVMFSANSVEIEIDAPSTAGAGEEIEFQVSIQNGNRTPLEDATLLVEFPEGTYTADDSGDVVEQLSLEIGTIEPQGSVDEEFEVFLFGEEGDDVEVEFTLEYNSASSSATLTKEETYEVNIVSAPVILNIDSDLNEVQSGNEFEIEVEVASNTNTSLRDLVLTAEYPGGFSFRESNPAPIEESNVWDIGELDSRDSETVTIRGSLEGQNNEERFITFSVGSETDDNPNQITRLFAKAQEEFSITEPPIALRTAINKNSAQVVSVPANSRVDVSIDWENTLSDDILNLALEASIDESLIEEGTINVSNGFYRSSQSTVVWDRTTSDSLGSVDAGSSGTVAFSFMTKNFDDIRSMNSEIPIAVRAVAQEPQSGSSPRSLSNELTREVRIASDLLVTQSLSHRNGPFQNTGPTPPRANQETTYTVTWRVASPANDIEDVTVRAALPTYVEFVEEEESGNVSVNSLTNEIIWRAGDISASASREISFQVAFEASASQVGARPIIVREAQVEGDDEFSGDRLRSSAPALRTGDLLESGAGPVVE